MTPHRRLILAAPALLAFPAGAAALPELTLWGPPAGPSVTLAVAVQQGFLAGLAPQLSVRIWRDPDEMRAGIASGSMRISAGRSPRPGGRRGTPW